MNRRTWLLSLLLATSLGAAPSYEEALSLFNQRKDAEAEAAFRALAAENPRHVNALIHLGRLAMRARKTDDALRHFQSAVELEPNNSVALGELGGAYGSKAQNAGLIEKASLAGKSRKAMERAVELDPNNADARSGLVQFYAQAPSMMGGGMDKAHAQADALIKLDAARGRAAKADLFVREKKYDAAFVLYDEAVKANPADYSSLYALGRLAAETGRNLDRGLETLRRCLELAPGQNQPTHAAAQWRIGNILERKGDRAAAKAAYQASLALDPGFTQAQTALRKLS